MPVLKPKTPNVTPPPAPPAPPPTVPSQEKAEPPPRKVVYPKYDMQLAIGEKALNGTLAKKLLGWEKLPEGATEGYLLVDRECNKIRCTNNVTNRPWYSSVTAGLVEKIKRKRWKFNFEPVIIGKTGLVLNGQHTLIAEVFAEQEYEKNKAHWSQWWDSSPTIDKAVAFGADEDDDTVNTMDTCKPRSLADVLYRSVFFKDMKMEQRKLAARMTEYAIKVLWLRTGVDADAFAPKFNHQEAVDFVKRHERILECVKHIMEENSKGTISKYFSPGMAAGVLYLMGSSTSDVDTYRPMAAPDESVLNWEMWQKATDFWVLLGSGGKELHELRMAMGALGGEEGDIPSTKEKLVVLAKAWKFFSVGETFKAAELAPAYHTDQDGVKILAECPIFGGIDVGEAVAPPPPPPQTPEQVEAAKKAAEDAKAKKLKEAEEAKAAKEAEKEKARKLKADAILKDREAKAAAKKEREAQDVPPPAPPAEAETPE